MKLDNKNILIAGGTGLIGRALIRELLSIGRTDITVASLDSPIDLPSIVKFNNLDLRTYENCVKAVKDVDIVINLLGIKTSPKIMRERPASIFIPYLQFNTNLMEAAVKNGVQWFLYTSSIGVYDPCTIMKEDDVWNTMPSKND